MPEFTKQEGLILSHYCTDIINQVVEISNVYREQKERVLKKYNYLLGVASDKEVGELFGITRARVQQIRKKWNILSRLESKQLEYENAIIRYLDDNKDKVSITYIRNNIAWSMRGKIISKPYIIDLAKTLNLEIKFKPYERTNCKPIFDFPDDFHYSIGKLCKCDICKLANTIFTQFSKRGISITKKDCAYFANKHAQRYIKHAKRTGFFSLLVKEYMEN